MGYSLRETGEVSTAARCNATLREERGQGERHQPISGYLVLMCDAEPLEACHIQITTIISLPTRSTEK